MAQVTFTGNVTQDPELKFAASGTAVLALNVAENHSRRNKDTQQWEETGTTWRRVTVFSAKAEALAEVLRKGDRVLVTGREETREYAKQDGSKGSSLEVTADTVAIVPKTNRNAPQQPAQQQVWEQNAPKVDWGNPPF